MTHSCVPSELNCITASLFPSINTSSIHDRSERSFIFVFSTSLLTLHDNSLLSTLDCTPYRIPVSACSQDDGTQLAARRASDSISHHTCCTAWICKSFTSKDQRCNMGKAQFPAHNRHPWLVGRPSTRVSRTDLTKTTNLTNKMIWKTVI